MLESGQTLLHLYDHAQRPLKDATAVTAATLKPNAAIIDVIHARGAGVTVRGECVIGGYPGGQQA